LTACFEEAHKIVSDSALAGVYIHGLTGDLAKEEIGKMATIAGDVLAKIPSALNGILR